MGLFRMLFSTKPFFIVDICNFCTKPFSSCPFCTFPTCLMYYCNYHSQVCDLKINIPSMFMYVILNCMKQNFYIPYNEMSINKHSNIYWFFICVLSLHASISFTLNRPHMVTYVNFFLPSCMHLDVAIVLGSPSFFFLKKWQLVCMSILGEIVIWGTQGR